MELQLNTMDFFGQNNIDKIILRFFPRHTGRRREKHKRAGMSFFPKFCSFIRYLALIHLFVAKETPKAKKSAENDHQVSSQKEIRSLFPVVAIGASSGGVQALSELLENAG